MLVDRLEQAGWVRRRPHPSDRRYVLVDSRIHDFVPIFVERRARATLDASGEQRQPHRPD